MPRYQARLYAPVSADRAFDYLADFSNAAYWDPSVTHSERLDQGPIRQGSEFGLTVRFLGRESTLAYRISRFEPGRLVRLEAENSFLRSVDTLSFRGDGSSSEVLYDAALSTRGIGVLAWPVLRAAFGRLGRAAEEGLQTRLASLAGQSAASI